MVCFAVFRLFLGLVVSAIVAPWCVWEEVSTLPSILPSFLIVLLYFKFGNSFFSVHVPITVLYIDPICVNRKVIFGLSNEKSRLRNDYV